MSVHHFPLKLRQEDRGQRGINIVDLMMWIIIATLLLAAALLGIDYYRHATLLNILKGDAAAAGTNTIREASMGSGDLDLTSAKNAVLNTSWSSGNSGLAVAPTGEPLYLRASSTGLSDVDVIYMFKPCSGLQIGVNVVPKVATPDMTSCGVSDSPTISPLVTDGSAVMNTVWDTSLPGCSTIKVPALHVATGGTISWGDGTTSGLSQLASHTYSGGLGPTKVKISGRFSAWGATTGWTPTCLTQVSGWGETGTTDLTAAFYGATNLTAVAQIPTGVAKAPQAFYGAASFNGDVSSWDTSAVTDMTQMFYGASAFNQNISGWNTAKVTSMDAMFQNDHAFNQPIGAWNTAAVTDMANMFYNASAFNQPIGAWNTASVVTINWMFFGASAFNQPIGNWNTPSLTSASAAFYGASAFNQSLSGWNTAKVSNMGMMFYNAGSFNGDISSWNTGAVTNMSQMFYGASAFNRNIGGWNTANVSLMNAMFQKDYAFNQNIGSWNTAKATTMSQMFASATSFNQPIGAWNTSTVANMGSMFAGASKFNQNIASWNTAKVTDMTSMLSGASVFLQDLSGWNVVSVLSANHNNFAVGTPMPTAYMPHFA